MNKHCYGCGSTLQDKDKKASGYVLDLNNDDHLLCQRCFRMKHNNEYHSHYLDDNIFKDIIKETIKKNNLVVLVVDLFDLAGTFNSNIISLVKNNPVILVGSKRDLLLKSLNDRKIKDYLRDFGKSNGLDIKDVIITSATKKYHIDELLESIFTHYFHSDVYVVGVSNAGKSSLVNALINAVSENDYQITISNYPGTTLDTIKIEINEDCFLYDTPGLVNKNQMIHYVELKDYKYFEMKKEVKARLYQLSEKQSVYIGGLACFNFIEGEKSSFNFFFNTKFDLHRTKYDNRIKLYDEHSLDDTLIPRAVSVLSYSDFEIYDFDLSQFRTKVDICIEGFGWISTYPNDQKVSIAVVKGVEVSLRPALI